MTTEQHVSVQTRLERAWLKPLTSQISGWEEMGYVQRFVGRDSKNFLLVRLDVQRQPEILERLVITNFNMSLLGGQMLLQSDKRSLRVEHAPVRIGEYDVYLWLPAHLDARYLPFPVDENTNPENRQVQWRFCMRSASNPQYAARQQIGDVFFVESREFRKIWPEHAAMLDTHN